MHMMNVILEILHTMHMMNVILEILHTMNMMNVILEILCPHYIIFTFADEPLVPRLIDFDFWCLTPLSAISQLYHGDQF